MGNRRGAYRVLVGKHEGKGQLEDAGVDGRVIFKKNLREIGRKCMDWIKLVQDRDNWRDLVKTVMVLR